MVTRHWYFIKLNDPQFSEVYRVTCWQNIAKFKNRKEVLNTIFFNVCSWLSLAKRTQKKPARASRLTHIENYLYYTKIWRGFHENL